MNIKGKARGGPRALARHVLKEENEEIRLIAIHGLAGRDIEGALIEMDALGAALRTDKTLYHGIISPAQGRDFAMTAADWELTRAAFLKGMGFENQPYVEIEHEKFGKDGVLRRHRHIIVGLTDLEHNRAINTSHNYRKHEEIARNCERQLGHEHVQGAHVDRFGVERPPRTPTVAEMRAAERGGATAKQAKALGAAIWRATDSGKAINAALAEKGWQLARGDKQRKDGGAYFMAIDPAGEAHELRRMVPVKAAELYARLADLDPANLPSVEQAKQLQAERQAQPHLTSSTSRAGESSPTEAVQQGKAAQPSDGATDAKMRPDAPQREAQAEKTVRQSERDLRQEFFAAIREAAAVDRQARADIFAGKQELRQAVRAAEKTVHATFEAPARATDKAIGTGLSIAGQAAKVFQSLFSIVSGFLAAEPKQTRQQMRDEAQAAGNVETRFAQDAAAAQAANDLAHDWQAHDLKSAQQEKDVRLAQTIGTNPTAEANLNRDEHDRQREREREL